MLKTGSPALNPDLSVERKELAYWLALLRAPGIGPARFSRLLTHFGSPRSALAANRGEWAALNLPDVALDYLDAPDWRRVDQDLLWLEQPGNRLIGLHDPDYPPLLKQIETPPPLLFVHGNSECLHNPQIAIVGTRHPTATGRENARRFAAHLAEAGFTITSGLALGVDAEHTRELYKIRVLQSPSWVPAWTASTRRNTGN